MAARVRRPRNHPTPGVVIASGLGENDAKIVFFCPDLPGGAS
jgi:hypothetical protein